MSIQAKHSVPMPRRSYARPVEAPPRSHAERGGAGAREDGRGDARQNTGRRRTPAPAARVASGRLPGWGELGGAPPARKTGRVERALGRVPTLRFALLVLLGALAFTLYVGHVYATRALYADLQAARRENLRLHLKHNRLKGEFDAATAPGVVVDRAKALGLEEGIAYGPTITISP